MVEICARSGEESNDLNDLNNPSTLEPLAFLPSISLASELSAPPRDLFSSQVAGRAWT
jgi:hypothetical protein